MQHAMKAPVVGMGAAMLLYGHQQYIHSLPYNYHRLAPYVVTVESVGSVRDPYDVNGQRVPRTSGIGSGFVINSVNRAPTHIITNYHVIQDSERVVVHMKNTSKPLIATVVGVDPVNDIAMIDVDQKIDIFEGLQLCSRDADVGEEAFAIGSPYGFEGSISTGIISGLDRSIGSGTPEHMIQTDVPINPGNSGGPLISRKDRCVLGVNTAAISQGSGLGFAVPSSVVKNDLKLFLSD